MEQIIIFGLGLNAWITILTVMSIFVIMARTRIPAVVAFLGAMTVLLIFGIVSEAEGMAGFGSEPVVVHAAFFVVMAGLMQTGVLYWLTKHVLGSPKNYRQALLKLMIPIAGLSALLNAVNVVALFIDVVKIWARKLGTAPSRLLIPLSYAATLGGTCTLIGNSSNLVISGLYAEQTGESMNLFAPLVPGLFCTVVGIGMVMLLRKMIPARPSPETSFESTSDYTVELLVPTDNPAVGMTADEAGLRNVRGGSLIEIVRFDKEIITPVPQDEFILGGDRLIYAGQINEMLELKRTHGLVAADHHVYNISEIDTDRKLRTAYVGFGSDLIGTHMSDNGFEHRTDMVLVAVARQGRRIDGQPREVALEAGDTLLLECPPKDDREIESLTKDSLTFFDSHFVPQLGPKTIVATVILLAMFVLSVTHVMPLMATTMLAAGAMLLMKCCRMTKVTKYIEWDLLLILGSTVVFSTAITKTGVAETVANGVLNMWGDSPNPYVIMALLCILASVFSEIISDVGACGVFFPIAYHVAVAMGCNPMPFVISLMLAVTISFASPIGSSTHMLIYGPGGFKFTDFMKIGMLMHVVLLAADLLIVNFVYPLYN
ncbi:MAG: SLC13 family permease [Prevotella sp.]|nr:SLC13 family permease [Prevotella sp.]